ncbi:MAG: DUF5995 family protein [Mycobacteriales bacterium]
MSATPADFAQAEDINGVLERMSTIDSTLPAADGVAYFNRMYREVTRLVADAVRGNDFFLAAEFLERLDVNFANLFFAAYADAEAGLTVPPAWAPLFEARDRPDTHPIQFALAGMNAHISHDLAFAVVETCREFGVVPVDESNEHLDFSRTNTVLAEAASVVKGWFLTGLVAELDEIGGKLDDGMAMFGIHIARAAAWETSEILWNLQDNPRTDYLFRSALTRTVELTSRGILL